MPWNHFILLKIFFVCVLLPATLYAQDAYNDIIKKQIAEAPNDSVRVAIMLKNAWEMKYAEPRQSIRYIDDALDLSIKNNFDDQRARAYYYKSIVYYLISKYDSSLMFNQDALEYYELTNNQYGIASIYNTHGLISEKIGDYGQAISDYQQSLVFASKTDNLHGQSNPLHNIGLIYSKTGDHHQALDYYRKALAVREKIGDSTLIGQSFQSIGMAYTDLGDTAKAIEFHEKALRIFETKEDLYDLALVYSNLGVLFLNLGKVDQAETYLNFALKLQKDFENSEGAAKALINLAGVYNYKQSFNKAVEYASEAIELCNAFDLKPELKLAYETLIISYENLKRYDDAYRTQKSLLAVSDSLLNEEKIKQITLLETRYQVQQKEQTISLQHIELRNTYLIIGFLVVVLLLITTIFTLARVHYKKKQALVQKESELMVRDAFVRASIQSQEQERKRFAQDIHDGMGQLISALKIMLKPISEKTSLEERVAIVERSENLLNDMHHEIRRIAFNLMPHTLVQNGLVAALMESVHRINSSGNVLVRVNSLDVPIRLAEVQEISLYRIIQEWINNVLKYAEATVIEVQLIGHEQELSITIEDNGRGFDPKALEESDGNGWKNINSRVNLIRGTLDIDAIAGRKGTTLTIKVPLVKNNSSVEPSALTA
jgi:two-component system, NarL family, sensor kinase